MPNEAKRSKHTWKPPVRFTSFFSPVALSTSLSSSDLILAALFFFFLTTLSFFTGFFGFAPPPRVDLARLSLFSSACSRAAKAASSSSAVICRLCFFLGGKGASPGIDSGSAELSGSARFLMDEEVESLALALALASFFTPFVVGLFSGTEPGAGAVGACSVVSTGCCCSAKNLSKRRPMSLLMSSCSRLLVCDLEMQMSFNRSALSGM